ncbi:MAG: AAA family ATPase [Candidatus Enterosoma sp.]|nr:AAA family ATPase [Candidatus Enterosoma sp.]
MVKVITGIKRCGKSYLLFGLFKKHLIDNGAEDNQIIEISLEDDKIFTSKIINLMRKITR